MAFPEKRAEEARAELPALLTAAEHGRTTVVTRRGHPVAALVPMAALEAGRIPQQALLPFAGTGAGLWGGSRSDPVPSGLLGEWLADETLPSGLMLALDAAAITRFLDGHPQFVERLHPLFAAHAAGTLHFTISTLALTQVLRGPLGRMQPMLAARYRTVLSTWNVVPVDAAVAAHAAHLCGTLKMQVEAAMTAACAISAGAVALVSPELRYERLSGLLVLC